MIFWITEDLYDETERKPVQKHHILSVFGRNIYAMLTIQGYWKMKAQEKIPYRKNHHRSL
jgi:hypothetical protein